MEPQPYKWEAYFTSVQNPRIYIIREGGRTSGDDGKRLTSRKMIQREIKYEAFTAVLNLILMVCLMKKRETNYI